MSASCYPTAYSFSIIFKVMEKTTIILSAESQFAREVALGIIYQLPLPIWYSLIPGMFLFDFIRRNRTISNFTKFYMFSRELALAVAASDGEKPSAIDKHSQTKIENWLKSQNRLSEELVKAQKKMVDVIAKHYKKLLNADGKTHNDLIENAYKTRKAFQSHLDKLEKTENKINQIMMGHQNQSDTVNERLEIEARQIKLRRNRMLEDIF